MANDNLGDARRAKNDEFYTQFRDIESEMNAYLDFNPDVFRDKTILLPCDDPEWSNFTKFFAQKFETLGIRKLISTSYAPSSKPKDIPYQPTLFELDSPTFDAEKSESRGKIFTLTRDTNGDNVANVDDIEWDYLEGDGDFRSPEVSALRDEADLIITNPPFSLFREFVDWLIRGNKAFSVIGNMNAVGYREIFPLIRDNKIWLGATSNGSDMVFRVPKGFEVSKSDREKAERLGYVGDYTRLGNSCWFSNIDHGKRHEPLSLMTMEDNLKFSKNSELTTHGYRKYDNYDAIEVPRTENIPSDYDGMMGVPISFLPKHNPEQFEILSLTQTWSDLPTKKYPPQVLVDPNGKRKIVGALNSSTAIKVDTPPVGSSYYEVDGEFFISTYKRLIIRRRKSE